MLKVGDNTHLGKVVRKESRPAEQFEIEFDTGHIETFCHNKNFVVRKP